MSESVQLSALQLDIMRVLWALGEATVADVHDRLYAERGLAPTTIATLLKRLDNRGLVTHDRRGRQFVYRPLVTEPDVRRSMVTDLTDTLFQGDVSALVSHLLGDGDIRPGDLERIKAMIQAKERDGGES